MEYYLTDEKTVVEVSYDNHPVNPRDWMDCLGTLLTGKDSVIENEGDFNSWDELLNHYGVEQSGTDMAAMYRDIKAIEDAAFERGDVILPVSTYEHSCMEVYVGTPADHFDGRWDCSFRGFIMVDDATIREEFGTNDAYTEDRVRQILKEEVETLSQYFNGEVYTFTEYDRCGELINCEGDFYTKDPVNNFESSWKIVEELGEYDSIEECLEKNQEKLGITIDPITPLADRVHFCEEKQTVEDDGIEAVERDDDAR